MLELDLVSRRGSFRLEVACRFESAWTVIFGPSGAGKSTLLRLLAGLDRPDSGQVVLDGEVLTNVLARRFTVPGRRGIGFVAQNPALFPHLSVAANVGYGLVKLDAQSRTRRVEEMLTLVGAENLAARQPGDLSGGEAQRVALARALAPMPKLLLLDEPFSALDGTSSDALLLRLQSWLGAHAVQTILVTHDATDAYAASADVALMHDGRMTALGAADEVLAAERERIISRLDGV